MAAPLYVLSPRAASHVETILVDTAEYTGQERSQRVEALLFSAFRAIAAAPGLGHLRPDILAAPVYFYYAKPFHVLYRKDVPIQIVAVFHGARDIAALMQAEAE
jgi:plasmid stabilization system protein ParE